MKILHINCNYLGTALHQIMIEKLDQRGVENQVFVPIHDKYKSVIIPNGNVCVSECFRKWDRFFFDFKQKKILEAIERSVDVSCFDLIHAYTLFTDGNCAKQLSEKYGIPYVVAVRNTDVNYFFKNRIFLRNRGIRILNKAEIVFFLSEAYRSKVIETYVPLDCREDVFQKSILVPNGIDDFWFQNSFKESKYIRDEKNVRLVYVGDIDKNKNITTTQRAMGILRQKGYCPHLTVVGRVKDKDLYQKILSDADTTCIPFMKKTQLLDLYRSNDIFVMPSIHETFGLVYAEAMSQALPVIYSKGQGFDKQFPDGEVGYSVQSRDAADVAEGIEKIVQNYDAISARAVKSIEKFRWAAIVDDYVATYKKLLSCKMVERAELL
ncbi:MAG: glycosyltransferase family 4 protein [Clostridia bacterium]|nr:glycosyltransferase family 4 protein [Clostridia bacterium]